MKRLDPRELRTQLIADQAVARALEILRPNPEGLDERTMHDVARAAAYAAAELVAADMRVEAELIRTWNELRLTFEQMRPARPIIVAPGTTILP